MNTAYLFFSNFFNYNNYYNHSNRLNRSLKKQGLFIIFSIISLKALAVDLDTAPLPTIQSTRYLASACTNCHGSQGISSGNIIPNLAGLNANYIRDKMHLFKNGTIQATVMHQLAKAYTDEEISILADYFSVQSTAITP